MRKQNKNTTVGLHTLGCKVNQYETDAIAGLLKRRGYIVNSFDDVCDVYIVNTCTVTSTASRKSGQFIRRARTKNPDAVVIEMGCRTQIDGASGLADISLGASNKHEIIRLLDELGSSDKPLVDIPEIAKCLDFEEFGPVDPTENNRAFVKIEDGCDRFCSYCIIPYARGRVRSRDENSVIREVKTLAQNGYREIILTGIDLSSYGKDTGRGSEAVIELADKLSEIEGIERIRLGSLEPNSITHGFVSALASSEKICPHIHMSLQSGSDTVLKRMNRHYTTALCLDAARLLREKIPEVMITADIITGFPGESEEEHGQTMRFCREMDLLDMHVFKFSKRKGTKAAGMPDQVPAKTAARRSEQLQDLAREMRISRFKRASGKTYDLLIEKTEKGTASGYTQNYMPAEVFCSKELHVKPGDIHKFKAEYITGNDHLSGNLL